MTMRASRAPVMPTIMLDAPDRRRSKGSPVTSATGHDDGEDLGAAASRPASVSMLAEQSSAGHEDHENAPSVVEGRW